MAKEQDGWQRLYWEDEWVQDDELVFPFVESDTPWWQKLLYATLIGALLGLLGWYIVDGDMEWTRVLAWVGGTATLLAIYVLSFPGSTVLRVHISQHGFAIVRRRGKESHAWTDLESARFEDYPVPNLGTTIPCFRYRVGGKSQEITIGLEDKALATFRFIVEAYLGEAIPSEGPNMRPFSHSLSVFAAWLFGISWVGIIAAHYFVYYTLGTVIGLSFVVTAAAMAVMTWKHGTSKIVVTATAAIFFAAGAAIWTLDINVRNVLLDWEQQERQLGRPPWKLPNPQNDNNDQRDLPPPEEK